MTEWFQRQFGDRGELALIVSLGVDPHPSGDPPRDLTWGSLEVWAAGRCLTENVLEGAVSTAVRWNLLPVLEWLLDVGIRLVNEDPFPRFARGVDVADGADWYEATLSPPSLSPEAERRWFLRRSEWRHHHALRRAAPDVALPNLVFRRLGHHLEVSWDNESWPPPHPNLRFVERRGRALVPARAASSALREALTEVLSALVRRTSEPSLRALSARAAALSATPEDWRWLIHRPTADLIRAERPHLRDRLDAAIEPGLDGLYVPHTPETLLLSQVRLEHAKDVDALLGVMSRLPQQPLAPALAALIRPTPASHARPWDAGNDYAEVVRQRLGWGIDPLPELRTWLGDHGLALPDGDLGLPADISVLSVRTEESRALAHVNPHAPRVPRETGLATALGHVLLDDRPFSIDGAWEHWPNAARARAFGVALMLPEDGVRAMLEGAPSVGKREVRALMRHYNAGPFATLYRLKNLRIITEDAQQELMRAVA